MKTRITKWRLCLLVFFLCWSAGSWAQDSGKAVSANELIQQLNKAASVKDKIAVLIRIQSENYGFSKEEKRKLSKNIAPLLKDNSTLVRAQTINSLVELKATENAKDIALLLKDSDAMVRAYAVAALGNLGIEEYAEDIAELLKDSDDTVRENAAKALEQLGVKGPAPVITGQTYTNAEHGLKITFPAGWKWQDKNLTLNISGSIIEFQNGIQAWGICGFGAKGTDLKVYADAFVGGLKGEDEGFKDLGESKLAQGGIRHDCRIESSDDITHYANGFFVNQGKTYFISIWTTDSDWSKYEDDVSAILDSVKLLEGAKPDKIPAKESGIEGNTYTDQKYKLRITAPEGWTVRNKNFTVLKDALVEFEKPDVLKGYLACQAGQTDPGKSMEEFLLELKKGMEDLEQLSESKMVYGGIRRDFQGSMRDINVHYTVGFVSDNKNAYCLVIYTFKSEWNKHKDEVNVLFDSFAWLEKDETEPVQPPVKTAEVKTWRSEQWGFEIILPEDWEMTILDKASGIKIAGFQDKSKTVNGLIALEEFPGACDEYIKIVIDSIDKSLDARLLTEPTGEIEASATYTAVTGDDGSKTQYYMRVIDVSGTKLRFVAWVKANNYDEYKALLKKHAQTLKGNTAPGK